MSNLIKSLNNIRSLRVIARELTIEQLKEIQEKLQLVIEEKVAEFEANQRQEIERQERLAKYKELLIQDGITAEDIAELFAVKESTPRKKREPRPAKYQYTDENGQVQTWTGQGRTPKVIQAALNSGKSLSDFEI